MNSILSSLPSENRIIYEDVEQIIENITDISLFVHEMDKFEMALQARQYSMEGHPEKLVTPFIESATRYLKGSKHRNYYRNL